MPVSFPPAFLAPVLASSMCLLEFFLFFTTVLYGVGGGVPRRLTRVLCDRGDIVFKNLRTDQAIILSNCLINESPTPGVLGASKLWEAF